MALGLAAALLVFTGVWHMTEWLMGGRNRDTLRLIPIGMVYALLGWLIALGIGGWIVPAIAAVLTGVGGTAAFLLRTTAAMRVWVIWTFIVIDAVIVLSILSGLLT